MITFHLSLSGGGRVQAGGERLRFLFHGGGRVVKD